LTTTPRSIARAVLHAPGVRQARKATERAVTPDARVGIVNLEVSRDALQVRVEQQAKDLEQLRSTVSAIEANLPAVLNAIASMSGAARFVKREHDQLRSEFDEFRSGQERETADVAAAVDDGDLRVLGEMRPHVETLAWLMQRVETVRFEMLNELRYGQHAGGSSSIEPRVVNPDALEADVLRLNIGAGHIPMDGYVNVDMRELPGIDVVATVDDLPFEPGTVDEIYSSHTLEHFPQEVLRRQLLPYWASLLKPGGRLVTIAPDIEAMAADYVNGATPFDDFRDVLYGGQEYVGDDHFTGFTPESFSKLLLEAGFVSPVTVASDRRNGKCKEFEIAARKAS
jgi:predicted SAM-dependent methyltransferase